MVNERNIIKVVLPTIYGQAEKSLLSVIEQEISDAILLTGYSKTAQPITLELVARNQDSKLARGNKGQVGVDHIIANAPEQLTSTLPDTIVQTWDQEKISYTLSDNAGGFLCNHVFYIVLEWLKRHSVRTVPCGFMHIGSKPEEIAEAKRAVNVTLQLL